jgi:hypothetical protein
MLARSLAVAIPLTTTLLLASCQTLMTQKILPPELRDQHHRPCANNCELSVDPNKQEWAPENIDVARGNHFFLSLPEAWEFDDPPVALKPGAAPYLACPPNAKRRIICTLGNAPQDVEKIGYTIRVKVRPNLEPLEYDPFVWPTN